jgi:alkyl sulfatase BDS1-like metallo-beta-lactamase superfamily hydrolase
LAGAKELREGIKKVTTPATSSADVAANMPLDMFLDYLAIRLNGQRAAGKVIRLNFVFKDTNQQYAVVVKNGVLNYSEKLIPMPDAGITLKRSDLNDVLIGQATLKDKIANGDIKVEGDQQKVEELLSLMDHFEFWFNIITANPQQQ